jgi:hypothetical protein
MRQRAPGADIPEPLEQLVMQCLRKDPIERPSGADEVAAQLDRVARAGGRDRTTRTRHTAARSGPGWRVAGVASVVLVVLAAIAAGERWRARVSRTVDPGTAPVLTAAVQRSPTTRVAPALASSGDPVFPAALVADHYARASAALDARRFDEAEAEATAAIAADQHVSEAGDLLGLAYLRSGQRERAIAQWRSVLARDASNETARRLLRAAGESPAPR